VQVPVTQLWHGASHESLQQVLSAQKPERQLERELHA
jgi:hypothetical protein